MPSLKNYLELLGENFKFELSRQPGPPSDRRYEDIGRCITVVTWKNIFEDLCKLPELTQQLNVPPTIPDLTENERLIWNEGKFQPTHERLWCHPANQLLKEIFPDSHYDVLPFLPLYELFPDATFVNQKVDLEVHDTNNGRSAIFESKFHGVLPSGDSVKETQSLTLSSLGQICHYCMLSGTAIGVVITTVELIFIQITTEMNTDEVAQAMSEDMSKTASEANPQTPPMISKRASEWPSPATQTKKYIKVHNSSPDALSSSGEASGTTKTATRAPAKSFVRSDNSGSPDPLGVFQSPIALKSGSPPSSNTASDKNITANIAALPRERLKDWPKVLITLLIWVANYSAKNKGRFPIYPDVQHPHPPQQIARR